MLLTSSPTSIQGDPLLSGLALAPAPPLAGEKRPPLPSRSQVRRRCFVGACAPSTRRPHATPTDAQTKQATQPPPLSYTSPAQIRGRRHRRRAQCFGLPGSRDGAHLPTTRASLFCRRRLCAEREGQAVFTSADLPSSPSAPSMAATITMVVFITAAIIAAALIISGIIMPAAAAPTRPTSWRRLHFMVSAERRAARSRPSLPPPAPTYRTRKPLATRRAYSPPPPPPPTPPAPSDFASGRSGGPAALCSPDSLRPA